jgi:photosystem II stability/assembly factor-like uncharacterized protein
MFSRYAAFVAVQLLLIQPLSLAAQRNSELTTGRIKPQTQAVPGAATPILPPALPIRVLPISRFKLLAPDIGWAATNDALFRTTDGGKSWSDITPPNPHHLAFNPNHDNLASISFQDSNQGIVALAYQTTTESDDWSFDLSRSVDGGKSWNTTAVILPGLRPNQLVGTADMTFSDPLHGWINVGLKSSSAFQLGAVFATTDGGLHWSPLAGDPSLDGPILSLSTGRGWLLAHDGDELYFVNGGAASAVSLLCPVEFGVCVDTKYDLPVFSDQLHGYEAVTYLQASTGRIIAALFHTNNGGSTWNPSSTLTGLSDRYRNSSSVRTAVIENLWIVPLVRDRQTPQIMRISETSNMTADANTENDENADASFVSPDRGWIHTNQGLLVTNDGGGSWENITPSSGPAHEPLQTPSSGVRQQSVEVLKAGNGAISFSTPSNQYSSSILSLPAAGVDQRLGFDGYSVPTLTTM